LAVAPARCLYVGDTSIDMETALRAGMYPVGVLWGFRSREELERSGAAVIIAHPRELLPLLAGPER
jgi:phosphoglycolate phosphatase